MEANWWVGKAPSLDVRRRRLLLPFVPIVITNGQLELSDPGQFRRTLMIVFPAGLICFKVKSP